MENVQIWEKDVVIPTYEAGAPDKNPLFMEKRVYQGSSGKVYPYPVTVKISREKKDVVWHAVILENRYLKVMVLPQLGGRIQRAYDKTNGYDFVYYNHVIKPALVGLAGPWISGGIEFNWPQHHRPTTFMPVDHEIRENPDGSATVLCHDVDQMYGTKEITAITLYPDRAYIEIRGQLYNRTPLPQTFLWWANPAVSVNDQTQSVFPPDVHSVYDHGKRDVSRFPIATGVYYKHDYSEGVDISRYKNIPVPTSYMAASSKYDFVGGYDYGKEAGLLHVADHHISPGKKQWTWGCGDFGKAWDRNLTDEDGPYIELMTGVFTDNQPDFSWLMPFEEKTFTQYFMPYKKAGYVKNATKDAVIRTECTEEGFHICVYVTAPFENAVITVTDNGREVFEDHASLSPEQVYDRVIPLHAEDETCLRTTVTAGEKVLVSWQAEKEDIPTLAEPAKAAKKPEEIQTNEELYLTGQHIEQYRHATWLPDPYYEEGLRRDPGDIRINNAYGLLLLRRGNFAEAEKHFRKAKERLTSLHPNPFHSETFLYLGYCLFLEKKWDEAYDAFYKAVWCAPEQEMGFYYLAVLSAMRKDYGRALGFIEKSLVRNSHNIKARGLKAALLGKLGRKEEEAALLSENLSLDPFDYVSGFLRVWLNGDRKEDMDALEVRMRGFHENYLMTARDFLEWGMADEALRVLDACPETWPMLDYYRGYALHLLGREEEAERAFRKADGEDPACCFPNKLEDIEVLQQAMEAYPEGAKTPYYLGCLYLDKLQYEKAASLFEQSIALDDGFPTAHRNLAIVRFNKENRKEEARTEMERAFSLDESDARVFLELDSLYRILGMPAEERRQNYKKHLSLIEERDDLYTEYVTVLNLCGRYEEAYDAIMRHTFRPWEGAEGKISTQYKTALLQLARKAMEKENWEDAQNFLEKALIYPENLGEGRLEGTRDNPIWYTLALVREALGDPEGEKACLKKACLGAVEPAGVLYYYDQPADTILYQGLAYQKLANQAQANARFYKLLDYGERHLGDHITMDYFAVSLPDFLVFEEDLDVKNKAHCWYLMGLSHLGLGKKKEAAEDFRKTLMLDPSHENAKIYLEIAEN